MTGKDLDTLLSRPLADIPDNGFSRAVLQRASSLRLRETRLIYAAYAASALICLFALGATPLGDAIIRAADVLSGTTGLGAFLLTALSIVWIRRTLQT